MISYSETVPYIYDEADPFSDGIAAVRTGDLLGYIDTSGELIAPCQYGNYGSRFSEGYAWVSPNYGDYGTIDAEGNEIIPYTYGMIPEYSEGLAAVCMGYNDGWGVQNRPCYYGTG